MIELLLGIAIGLLLLCVGLLGVLLRRSGHDAMLRVTARIEALRESQERVTRAVVDEIGFGRREQTQVSQEQRNATAISLGELREALLEALASDGDLRKLQLGALAERLDALAQRSAAAQQEVVRAVRHDLRGAHEASTTLLTVHRSELQENLRDAGAATHSELERTLAEQLPAATHDLREQLADAQRVQAEVCSTIETLRATVEQGWLRLDETQGRERGALATAVENALGSFQDDHARRLERIRQAVEERLPATLDQRLSDSARTTGARLDDLRRLLDELRALVNLAGQLRS